MATKQARDSKSLVTSRQQILEAVERGELIQVLAKADAGRLDPREVEAALEQYERKHRIRRFFAALLGRRVS
jgi:hypothetical protein